jgi:hypothetical protein
MIMAGGIIMSVNVVELEAKLVWLQTEVAEALRQVRQIKLTPEEWEEVRIARVRAENESLRPFLDEAFEGMIDDEEPPSAEEIQELIAASGVKPEDNLFSRMLIEMREE